MSLFLRRRRSWTHADLLNDGEPPWHVHFPARPSWTHWTVSVCSCPYISVRPRLAPRRDKRAHVPPGPTEPNQPTNQSNGPNLPRPVSPAHIAGLSLLRLRLRHRSRPQRYQHAKRPRARRRRTHLTEP
jgi:hypothetical protein